MAEDASAATQGAREERSCAQEKRLGFQNMGAQASIEPKAMRRPLDDCFTAAAARFTRGCVSSVIR